MMSWLHYRGSVFLRRITTGVWQHALHHASAGDLDRRGTGDVWTFDGRGIPQSVPLETVRLSARAQSLGLVRAWRRCFYFGDATNSLPQGRVDGIATRFI